MKLSEKIVKASGREHIPDPLLARVVIGLQSCSGSSETNLTLSNEEKQVNTCNR